MPSTTPCFSMNSVQLLRTWGTEKRKNSVPSHNTSVNVCSVFSERYKDKKRMTEKPLNIQKSFKKYLISLFVAVV